MQQIEAERIITEYLKPIFGFALKRCRNVHDAEDLSQEIVYRAYRALLARDDIDDAGKFIWTVAHNALANYYRDAARQSIGISIDDMEELITDPDAELFSDNDNRKTLARMQSEIAYLSKVQRRIVIAYYYENCKQSEIAAELGIPLGTVKWHLFEAKKELKRGMETMRKASELKFNPVRFALCGFSGSTGTKGSASDFFRSPLSQNIEYAVWKEAKTVGEIADALGVSPVYVESEAEYLEEYGFLAKHGDKYLCNILLDETTDELVRLHDEMYRKVAKIFANELYDALEQSNILNDKRIACAQSDGELSFNEDKKADRNFLYWSLIPFIAALSGEALMDKSISFDEVMTIRPDGGRNICYASVSASDVRKPEYFDSMQKWCGPCWNGNKDYILWQIDSEWSEKRVADNYPAVVDRILSILSKMNCDDDLDETDWAFLALNGIMKTKFEMDGTKGLFKCSTQVVWLTTPEIKNELITIGDKIKEKHKAEFDALKAPYVKAVLEATPKQLLKMRKYGLQYIYFSDGWFLLHCMKELVNNGKLKLPTEEQKRSLTTIIAPNN